MAVCVTKLKPYFPTLIWGCWCVMKQKGLFSNSYFCGGCLCDETQCWFSNYYFEWLVFDEIEGSFSNSYLVAVCGMKSNAHFQLGFPVVWWNWRQISELLEWVAICDETFLSLFSRNLRALKWGRLLANKSENHFELSRLKNAHLSKEMKVKIDFQLLVTFSAMVLDTQIFTRVTTPNILLSVALYVLYVFMCWCIVRWCVDVWCVDVLMCGVLMC